MNLHRLWHAGVKPHHCSVCPVQFSNVGNLRTHVGRKHPELVGQENLLKCEHCDFRAPNQSQIKQHMFKHRLVESDHYCPSCHRYFVSVSKLHQHCSTEKHKRKALEAEGEPNRGNKNKIGGLKQLKKTSVRECSAVQKQEVESSEEKEHCSVRLQVMRELVESKVILRRYRKQQRRLQKGKPPKDTMFKCKWCKYQTGHVWDFFAHLRSISLLS